MNRYIETLPPWLWSVVVLAGMVVLGLIVQARYPQSLPRVSRGIFQGAARRAGTARGGVRTRYASPGSSSVIAAPPSALAPMMISPSYASTISRVTARPMPWPGTD